MAQHHPDRYGDIAVALHWLIAVLIIGLLSIGKYMTGLDEADPLRFSLTQWHKTFGILVLMLVSLRLIWRVTHDTPEHPEEAPAWEKVAAGLSHFGFYLLMFVVPFTGWLMVSASPLNIDTYLFNVIPWPHLPPFSELANKELWEHRFHDAHHFSTTAMIILLLLHVGAALKHHWINHDDVLVRMLPDFSHHGIWRIFASIVALTLITGVGLYASQKSATTARVTAGSTGQVSFVLPVSGVETTGQFVTSELDLVLSDKPENNKLTATVDMTSGSTGNPQDDSSMLQEDWFNVESFPTASYQSISITPDGENRYKTTGTLSIKGTSLPIEFVITVTDTDDGRRAQGEFEFNRLNYGLGAMQHPDDHTVGLSAGVQFYIVLD